MQPVCQDSDAGGEKKNDGDQSDTAETVRAETPPTDPAAGDGTTCRTYCLRRQLIRLLKGGSEYFTPEEVRRIVRAARIGPVGSLSAIHMLDDDMMLFAHAFPDADEEELRAQCRNTVAEYEELTRAWEEAGGDGELDSSSVDSEDEDELTGDDLLRDLEKTSTVIDPAAAPKAQPSYIAWPKRVLRQTILVSSIAVEIESNINRTDWNGDCYEECRKLLQHEAGRMEDISKDRGVEEIPVLVDLEVQHWMAEALEGAARASELVESRITQAGVRCPSRGEEKNRNEAGGLGPMARRVAQAVMDAATADPLNDSQLERVVRLALGKRVPTTVETGKAVIAHAAAAVAGGGGTAQTPAAGAEFIRSHQTKRKTEPEDEGESRPPVPVEAGESPPEVSGVQSAPPEQRQATTRAPSEVSEARSGSASQSTEMMTKAKKKRGRNKAARRATRAAMEAKEALPAAGPDGGTGGQVSSAVWLPRKKKMQCPVFGCTRKHAPGNSPTFQDMTPKERLDLVHMIVLLGAPDGQGVRDHGQMAQLHRGWLRQAASQDAAWSPEGRRVFSAGKGYGAPERPAGNGDGR